MDRLPFIDAHMHLWDLGHIRYPWLTPPFSDGGPNGSVAAIASDYRLADYRQEAAGWNVVGAVHVDAGAHPEDALAETDWLEEQADADGLPLAIIAFAALDDPHVRTLLAAHAQRGRVRGIRHIVNWHPDPRRTYTARDITKDEAWEAGFAQLAGHGLSFDLQAYPNQFAHLAALLARHPDVPVALNHAGMGVDGAEEWRTGMAALARVPQVQVKLSGMGFAFRPLDSAAVRDRVRATIDLFGVDRCMIASDFPTDRLFASFDNTMAMLADAVADLSEHERRALFARNANAFYRLNLDV